METTQDAGMKMSSGVPVGVGASTTVSSPTTSTPTNSTSFPANNLDVIQDMIDISADRLEGLRTQCATSATLTQQEIRSLETKLVRMFSELLLTKSRLNERIPASGLPHTTGSELKQWLRVVGLSQDSLNVCLTRLSTLEHLLEQTDDELKQLLCNNPSYRDEEVRRLTKAMQNLRKCRKTLSGNSTTTDAAAVAPDGISSVKEQLTEQLFWDSWDRHPHHHHRGSVGNIGSVTASPRPHRILAKQVKQHQALTSSSRQSPSNDSSSKSASVITTPPDDLSSIHGSTLTLTLTPSPPNSPFAVALSAVNFTSGVGSGVTGGSLNGTPLKMPQRHKAGTPPPMKKHQLLSGGQPLTPTHSAVNQQDAALPIAKSKSHESQFQDTSLSAAASSPPSHNFNTAPINNSTISRSRLNTDPSPDSFSSASSDIFVENPNNLQVPRSPCTPIVPLSMGHTIPHRFTKVFKMMSTCDLCQKQMFFGLKCKECKYRCHKDCEPSVPPSCGLPPELVDEFIKQVGAMGGVPPVPTGPNTSPNLNTLGKNRSAAARHAAARNAANTIHHPDSSSPGSSCNSSSPSSPALFNLQQQHAHAVAYSAGTNNVMSSSGGGSSSTSGGTTTSNVILTPSSFPKHASQFNFPDVTITSNFNQAAGGGTTQMLFSSQTSGSSGGGETSGEFITSPLTDSIASKSSAGDSMAAAIASSAAVTHASHLPSNSITISSSNCSSVSIISSSGASSVVSSATFYGRKLSSAGVDSRRPHQFSELSDTHKSNDSDKTVSLSGSTSASTDSDRTPVRLDSTEDGDSGNWPRQNSLSLKEWDIPYSDLHLLEKIGKGRFGTVHRALWHGDVAVKLLKEDYLDDEQTLEAFKLEVANFKKTRHENLVLFMGACMNPPYLAIVTSLCKGNTLFTYIHARRDKFTINRTTLVAQQISQGMGYLHARGIFHKDLRTKNIFLENGKVIITDFGLFSSTKLLYCDIGLGVPNGWLCYLAPELMRALLPRKPTDEVLPFSKASDVYSFGTVWYELLCGEFPFKLQPPEAIIWQVGRGMKQTLANLQTSRDVKDILMLCWSFQADDRPDFPKLLTLLERLPKKRLARSPSHPVQLSRSAESVF